MRLADIDAGSSTPSLVSKVFLWKRENQIEAEAVYKNLGQKNSRLVELFTELNRLSEEEGYRETIGVLAECCASEWKKLELGDKMVRNVFIELYETFQDIRAGLREIGQGAGVPVEPESMTGLLDECMSVPGILIAGVPGAGMFLSVYSRWIRCDFLYWDWRSID